MKALSILALAISLPVFSAGVQAQVAVPTDPAAGAQSRSAARLSYAWTQPVAPSAMSYSVSSSSVRLYWADSSWDELGFRVYRWNGANWITIADLAAGSTAYTDSGLYSSSTYYYTVSAYNYGGESFLSQSPGYVAAKTSSSSAQYLTPGQYDQAVIDACVAAYPDYIGYKSGSSYYSDTWTRQSTTGGAYGSVISLAIPTGMCSSTIWYYWGGWGELDVSWCFASSVPVCVYY